MGYVCRVDENEDGGKEFVALSQFDGLNYWNHDIPPNETDAPAKLMRFVSALHCIHSRTEAPAAKKEEETKK